MARTSTGKKLHKTEVVSFSHVYFVFVFTDIFAVIFVCMSVFNDTSRFKDKSVIFGLFSGDFRVESTQATQNFESAT